MTTATLHGYPRQGPHRELKRAIEAHWRGRADASALLEAVGEIRRARLTRLAGAGLTEVPIGDFSLYDHVLDTTLLLGAIPSRYGTAQTPEQRLAVEFAMARGTDELAPLEMTKWFDTNYHYLVPEIGPETPFDLDSGPLLAQVAEAVELGLTPRVVLVGPVTWLCLARSTEPGFDPLTLLDRVLDSHRRLLGELAEAGVGWVQYDESILCTEVSPEVVTAVRTAHTALADVAERPQLLIGAHYGPVGDHLAALLAVPVEGFALDLTGPERGDHDQLQGVELSGRRLIAGIVDGRNVWRTDLAAALDVLEPLASRVGQLDVAAASSLLHVPIDLAAETDLDPQVVRWLAFADQKITELTTLAEGLTRGRAAVADALADNAQALADRRQSGLVNRAAVQARAAGVQPADLTRPAPYETRRRQQHQLLSLPPLPTTTVGSFPQTAALRTARAEHRAGRLDQSDYQQAMRDEVAAVIATQERLGLDVLVHGEPERNDMVQYFAEQLDGFVATTHGWVQSYGTRCVRPPIIVGDVARPAPMTVEWARHAQSLTDKPVKGMLTGPVTMLAWSFVRDDQPIGQTARQVALALRDEVADLEAAGIGIIQVDEPALRETLPLREAGRADYLRWAVDAFRLTTAVAGESTQVHTHMCYADFADILEAINQLDADVISLEASRSGMEVVADLATAGYPREVGPGVWDIHSPRVPGLDEIAAGLRLAIASLPAERVWVNPDCGLKTRGYAEVEPSLTHMVGAARAVRAEIG